MATHAVDLVGATFARWRVLAPAGRNKHRQALWRLRCRCGTEAVRTLAELRKGKSQSCGCLRREQLRECNRAKKGRRLRELPERKCERCGRAYRPRSKRAKYCSPRCKGRALWQRIALDPAQKKEHAHRVNRAHKRQTYTEHAACAWCGQPFHGPPSRRYCSAGCLESAIRSGKYRTAFQRRRAEAELAALQAELHRRHSP